MHYSKNIVFFLGAFFISIALNASDPETQLNTLSQIDTDFALKVIQQGADFGYRINNLHKKPALLMVYNNVHYTRKIGDFTNIIVNNQETETGVNRTLFGIKNNERKATALLLRPDDYPDETLNIPQPSEKILEKKDDLDEKNAQFYNSGIEYANNKLKLGLKKVNSNTTRAIQNTPQTSSSSRDLIPKAAQQLGQKGAALEAAVSQHFKQEEQKKSISQFIERVKRERNDFGYKTSIDINKDTYHRVLVYNNINAQYNNKHYNFLVLAISMTDDKQSAMLSNGSKNLQEKTLDDTYSFGATATQQTEAVTTNISRLTAGEKILYNNGRKILKNEFGVIFLKPVSWYAWGKSYFNKFLFALGLGAACYGAYCYIKSPSVKK